MNIALITALLLSQVITPPQSLEGMLSWTPPKFNVDGTPLTDLKGYLLSVTPDDADLRIPGTPALQTAKVEGVDLPECADDECVFPAFRLLDGLGAGKFRMWIQAYDLAGNLSPYSEPTELFDLDVTAPVSPSGLKFTVKVIVEVRIQ